MQLPTHRSAIERITPYVPGKPIADVKEELGLTDVIKLASNENPLGPSPRAVQALQQAITAAHIYPDGAVRALRAAIAQKNGVDIDQVFVGNGSDEVIKLLAETYLNPEDAVVFSDVTFSEYAYSARIAGAQEIVTPVRDETNDLEAMATSITPQTKLVYVCNPNNPTGTYVNQAAVERFMASVPAGVLVVFDEAYVEYADAADFPNTLALLKQGLPVASMRTFSKIYGLAGLRVGYIIAPEAVVAELNRVKEPFSVNALAQAAALAALDDEEHVRRSQEVNAKGKEQLYELFSSLGLQFWHTQANFVFVDIGRASRPVYEALLRRGVIVRTGDNFGRPNALRVTVGVEDENNRFAEALREVLA